MTHTYTHIQSLPFLWIIYFIVNEKCVLFKYHLVCTRPKKVKSNKGEFTNESKEPAPSKWRIDYEFEFGVNACSIHVWKIDSKWCNPCLSHGNKNGELISNLVYSMLQSQVSEYIHTDTNKTHIRTYSYIFLKIYSFWSPCAMCIV